MLRLVLFAALAALALPASAQESVPDAPDRDGIHVVGEWTLTVLEPDGSVVERREFHNDLVSSGASVIAGLLTGLLSHGRWYVLLQGSPSPCGSAGCRIDEVPAPNAEPHWFGTLSANRRASASGGGLDTITLTGSFEAIQDGEIRSVATAEVNCPGGTVTPEDCAPGQAERTFTSRVFDAGSELAVAAGQTVNVQVDITFE